MTWLEYLAEAMPDAKYLHWTAWLHESIFPSELLWFVVFFFSYTQLKKYWFVYDQIIVSVI